METPKALRSGLIKSLRRHISSVSLAAFIAAQVSSAGVWARPGDASSGDAPAAPEVMSDPGLDAGFRLLYELKFDEATAKDLRSGSKNGRRSLWGRRSKPLPIFSRSSIAKAYLLPNSSLTTNAYSAGSRMRPTPSSNGNLPRPCGVRKNWQAFARLVNQPKDPDSLFALTLVAGMQADDFFLIQRRQLESMRGLREADRNARILLAVAPNTDDAYVALGVGNYVIGCLPSYKRAVLWMGGIHGDKVLGMQQVARGGYPILKHTHYLRHFAGLMLALAALRERNTDLARSNLQELVAEFPENPLFASELTKITPVMTGVSSHNTP